MESLGITLFVVFFVYLLLGMPLAICLGLSVITTFWYHDALPLMAVAQKLYNGLDHFALMAIPFFILASNIMSSGGVSKRLIAVCNAFVGHYKGGLAVASIVSCMFFAAISGSSPSTVVAIGTIMIPAMIASGYGPRYSVGLLGSAGSLGILIPPSIPMIVYGVATEQSVGKLFMAGVGPGLFMGSLFIITAVIYARVKGFKGGTVVPWKDRLVLLWKALPGLFMPFLILGGIYGGIFTPTEAAAVAVFYSLFVGLFVYKDLKIRDIPQVFVRSAIMMAMILFIITNAMLFAYILTTEGIPAA
ncbi:MAG: TRAP transporter large permease, partial [Desulfobacteraceae bacterium]|nr:TRAP transporter large permease [Desulfobacteraceae bacterium]